jgi:DNA-binding LacI/PurR family transcriptional regulator
MNIIRGIEHACKPANYRLLLFESEMSPEIEQRAILQAREAGAQGLIVYPVEGNANLGCFEQLQRDRVPFVLVDRYFPALACDVVVPNNVALAYKLTTFLIEAGHRHVATLWSEVACTSVHDRMSGYKLALQNHGIAVEPALMDLRTYETLPEQERHALLTTWIGAPNSPTAYLAVNAGTLATVARDLRALGVHIPGDAALVSMDSTTIESILAFATATADLPSYDIGQSAVRLLRERLEGAADRPPQHIVLPASIQANALGDGVTQPVPGANGELTARNVSPVEQPTVVGAS